MNFRHFVAFGALGFALLAQVQVRAECECPEQSVEEAIRQADRIFRGRAVSAAISGADSRSIEFIVEVDETIRGNVKQQMRLTTPMPDQCGVGVRLDFRQTFVLRPGEPQVSRCSGSGVDAYRKNPLLDAAIRLVNIPAADVSSRERLLSEHFFPPYNREFVDEFFELVTRIDPAGFEAIGKADRIEYRGIVVYFKDDHYEKIEAL